MAACVMATDQALTLLVPANGGIIPPQAESVVII
jgi:hypothetical protein